jgi:putative colanic acid biosynthesis glycosyltransferase
MTNTLQSGEITIISITKNDGEGIRRTVESVLTQVFANWRLVIVLSGENDSSLEYVKKLSEHSEKIHYLIPESLGIYNAMNYAMDQFNPRLTWFLNGGDAFKSESTLSNAYSMMMLHKPSVLLGGYEVNSKDSPRQFVRSARKIEARGFSLNVRSGNHQAMLFDFSGFEKLRFNLELKLASDFLMVLEMFKIKPGFRISEALASIEPNGISSLMIDEVWMEKQIAREIVFGRYSADYFLGFLWTLAVKIKRKVKRCIS